MAALGEEKHMGQRELRCSHTGTLSTGGAANLTAMHRLWPVSVSTSGPLFLHVQRA